MLNSEQCKWLCLITGDESFGEGWKNAKIAEESDGNKKLIEEIEKSDVSPEEKKNLIADINKASAESLKNLEQEFDELKTEQMYLVGMDTANQDRKKEVLAYVRSTINEIRDNVRKAFDQQVTFLKTKAIQDQNKAKIDTFNDDNMAFDFMEDVNDLGQDFLQGPVADEWSKAQVRIAILAVEMEEARFTQDEITKELYTPLVQQQILPETFVPDAYSAVQQMINETNKLYIEELAEADKEKSVVSDIIKDTISTSANIVKASLGISEEAGAITEEQKELGDTITDIISVTATTTVDTVETLYTSGNVGAAIQTIFNDMAATVGSTVETAMGGTDDSKVIATFVTLSMQSAATGAKIVTADDPGQAFLGSLESIMTTGCNFGANATDEYTANIINIVKAGIQNAFSGKAYVEKLQGEIKGMKPFDIKKALMLCLQGVSDAVNKAIEIKDIVETQQKYAAKKAAEEKLAGMDPDSEDAAKIQAMVTALDKDLHPEKYEEEEDDSAFFDDGFSLDAAKEFLGDQIDVETLTAIEIPTDLFQSATENIKKHEEAAAATLKDEMNRLLGEEEQELQNQMSLLQSIDETAPSDQDLQTIEKLLAQLQKDREIWDKVFSIGEKGAGAAKAALTVLGPGVTMIKLIKAISEVVIRTKEVLNWKDNLSDAEVVSNPYLTSVQGMLKQQTEHLTQDSIAMALLIIKLAGEIVELTPASAVGKLISASADIAIETEEFIYRQYKRAQLKKAWEQTKIALQHPEFRRQNLYVRKLNPTLAKYTIAFGSVVAKDPIAKYTMNKIGLTNEMLEHPSAGVGDVKKYLETRYNKDMEVKLKFVADDDWVRKLPSITLEITHWYIIASKAREIHVGCNFDDGKIKAALTGLKEAQKLFLAQEGIDEIRAYCASFSTLKNSFEAFSATDAKGKPLQTLASVKDEYLGLIDAETENMNSVKNAIEKRIAQLVE